MQYLFALAGVLGLMAAVMGFMGYRGREQIVGIDLGTTFSVVALKYRNNVYDAPKVLIIPDGLSGKPLVPSVVTIFENGSTIVGERAAKSRQEYPLNTIFNAKRFIGQPASAVKKDAESHPFRVEANKSREGEEEEPAAGFAIPQGGRNEMWVSPIDIGSEVVKHLRASVQKYLGYPISRAVICVPAKFGWKQTKATKEAFEKAGIKVMRVLEEPTAAAVAYNLHKTSAVKIVLVYDIGGGTLDTSLLYMNGKSVSVLGVAGDDHLGGSDFDVRMRDLLMSKLQAAEQVVIPASDQPVACDRSGLYIAAERAKITLSDALTTVVQCREESGAGREMSVTRAEFEQASSDLFARSMDPVAKVLEDQMLTKEGVDDIVLVGGASRTPRLRVLLQEFFGAEKKLHTDIDPDVTVAYGASNIID